MKNLLLLFTLVLVTGCNQQSSSRQYTEVATDEAQTVQAVAQEAQPTDNPHADINMGKNIAPDAASNLQKMLAEGQDPHAGIDMSSFGAVGKDPHAGMNMAGDMSAMMPTETAMASPYDWTLPNGWKQGPKKGMRLASFYIDGTPDAIDCSIVSLPGPAGGLEANLKRWMGQVAIETSDANVQKLIGSAEVLKTQGGLESKFYDLTALQTADADKSMMAVIVSAPDATLFVKMVGTVGNLKQNKESYLELVKSLSPKK